MARGSGGAGKFLRGRLEWRGRRPRLEDGVDRLGRDLDQAPQVAVRDRQRRHQDDDVAERADDRAPLARLERDPVAEPAAPGRARRGRSRPSCPGPGPRPPRACSATSASSSPSRRIFGCRRGEGLLALEGVEVGERRGAGERVAGVGVAVEEGALLLGGAEEALVDPLGGQRRRQRQVAAGQALGEAEQVRARRPPARRRTSSRCGRSRSRPRRRSAARRSGRRAPAPPAGSPGGWTSIPAAPWTSGSTITAAISSSCAARVRSRSARVAGLDRVGLEQQRPVGGVEEVDAADRDRPDRVAVVGVAEVDERGPPACAGRRAAAGTGRPSSARSRPRSSPSRSRRPGCSPGGAISTSRAASSAAPGWVRPSIVEWATRSSWSRTAWSISGWRWPWTLHQSEETPSM